MLRLLIFFLSGIVLLAIFLLIGLAVLASQSRKNVPDRLADRNLAEESENPNYVSSLVQNPDRFVEALRFEGDPSAAWNRVRTAARQMPQSQIRSEGSDYLHIEYHTPVFGFVDDLELLIQPDEKIIHVRSESRVGRSDLGANAKRVEELRARFRSLPNE